MQPDYMPLGWLGIIIGGKIYYNFAKQSFEQTFINMGKEINRYASEESTNSAKPNKARQQTNSSKSNTDNSSNSSSSLSNLCTPEPNGVKNPSNKIGL